ncbi:EpsG family protein [Chitinophaga sp. CF118]|uniref:EpsG family protein n=1 Tax=Chitinophaga sp. CF118 TaxID=1884367 RepID=UPI0015A6D758|nr:EpsG family protein [Chitinophaga sp. CF118]
MLNGGVVKFFLLLIALSVGLISYTTKSISQEETDINRYYFVYQSFANVGSFRDFVFAIFLEGEVNPLFQSINFLLAKTFPENPQMLPLFWVTITYYFSFITYYILLDICDIDEKRRMVFAVAIALVGVIYFGRTTESIKQCSSAAIFGYAVARAIMKKGKGSLFVVIAILVHISSIILLPIYWSVNSKFIRRHLKIIFIFCFLASFIDLNKFIALIVNNVPIFPAAITDKLLTYEDYNVPSSIRLLITFFIYAILIGLLAWHYYKKKNERDKTFLIVQVVAFCILLINKSNAHNFMRYIYSYFPFIGMAYLKFSGFNNWKKNEYMVLHFVFISFLIYSNISYLLYFTDAAGNYANSYLDNSVRNLFIYNVVDYLNYKVVIQ